MDTSEILIDIMKNRVKNSLENMIPFLTDPLIIQENQPKRELNQQLLFFDSLKLAKLYLPRQHHILPKNPIILNTLLFNMITVELLHLSI